MKKHTKLMMQALGLAAVFALAGSSIVEAKKHAGDNDDHHAEGGKKRSKRGGRGSHGVAGLNHHIDEHVEKIRKDSDSLHSQFLKAKAADAKSIAPKSLAEIGAMVDDSARRMELFKFIEASKAGAMILDADKASFAALIKKEIDAMHKEKREIMELVGGMALDNNFALMAEEDVLKNCRAALHHGAGMVDKDGDGRDDRDTNRDGVVSQEERSAVKKGKGKQAAMIDADGDGKDDRDTDGDGKVSVKEKRAAKSKGKGKGKSGKGKGKGKAGKGKGKGKTSKGKGAMIDANHDGLDDRDANHDGKVSTQEAADFVDANKDGRNDKDLNKDGKVTDAERAAYAAAHK